MKYVLLLRGINVGGKNKVKMESLKQQLNQVGCANTVSYINSGNLIFEAREGIEREISRMLAENYDFEIPFALIPGTDYEKTAEALPDWWKNGGLARRDALFFTGGITRQLVEEQIGKMKLHDEIIHCTDIGVFWGKIHQEEYLKTAYHKQLGAEAFYKKVTIRNGNTVEKLLELVREGGKGMLNESLIYEILSVVGEIPPGKAASYGQIARLIGRDKNARLVGKVLSMAQFYGDYPCHRVVNHAGRLVPGWAQQGELLKQEGVTMKDADHVDMKRCRWEPEE